MKASTVKKPKAFKVNAKNGTVTVAKGTKKGTYKLKVNVTSAGNDGCLSTKKTVSVVIRVK